MIHMYTFCSILKEFWLRKVEFRTNQVDHNTINITFEGEIQSTFEAEIRSILVVLSKPLGLKVKK